MCSQQKKTGSQLFYDFSLLLGTASNGAPSIPARQLPARVLEEHGSAAGRIFQALH